MLVQRECRGRKRDAAEGSQGLGSECFHQPGEMRILFEKHTEARAMTSQLLNCS